MNDMRERLISLLQIKPWADLLCKANIELFADHLLANGVIVLPCKVGDTVYLPTYGKVKACGVVFVGLSVATDCCYFNFVENHADGTFYKTHSALFAQIGSRVFLTREEAERALKERVNNDE